MTRLRLVAQLMRYFGVGWVLFRMVYGIKGRTGWFKRRFPPFAWSARPLGYWLCENIPTTPQEYVAWRRTHPVTFFFKQANQPHLGSVNAVSEADRLLDGEWLYFESQHQRLGMSPAWNLNPVTGQTVNPALHWSEISDFAAGDIKFIWEPSRFSAVFTLVRAFAASGDRKYGDAFWTLVARWADHNPPHLGPNWMCGQEASFRVMAWCFGLYAFAEIAQPDQIAQLVCMIAAHGDRIAGNIDYARSQNNNHGISEGVGLWTIGTLFPELRDSRKWTQRGKQVIEEEVKRQIYADGSYAQYSPNYQRVMLHDLIWAVRLGELNEHRFSDEIYERVQKSTTFLLGLLDPVSGRVPNHGSNDSALVLPLTDQSVTDFRPVIQSAWFLVQHTRLFETIYDEARWLFGAEAMESAPATPVELRMLHASHGGYYSLRGGDSWLMVRCAQYKARPHHADQLHVDFWWRGINVCCDAGTYLYNGPDPWRNGLSSTSAHNTVIVEHSDQMTRYSRFLWLDWSRGFSTHHDPDYWEGWHDGYRRLHPAVRHRRAVQRVDDAWLIVDETTSTSAHASSTHWLILDMPYQVDGAHLEMATPEGAYHLYFSDDIQLLRAAPESIHGWRSLFYGTLEPALSVTAARPTTSTSYSWTVLSPRPITVERLGPACFRMRNRIFLVGGEPLVAIEES